MKKVLQPAYRLLTGLRHDNMSVGLLAILYIVIALTFQDYGRTWDEAVHMTYGNHILRWYTSGFADETAITYRIDYLYGGGFDLSGALFRRIAKPLDGFRAMHLFGGIVGVLGIVGTWRLGRALGGPRAGFISIIMISLTPSYYGHMFNNPKDLPFAVGYVWGLYFIVRITLLLPRIPSAIAIKTAIAFGLAMSVRIGGMLLLCYFALALVAWAAYQAITRRDPEIGYQYARHLAVRGLGIAAGAWAVMLIWWPWAALDPLKRPIAALKRMSQFIDHVRDMPFNGEWISNLDAPRDYTLHYLAYKIPETVLFFVAFGVYLGLAWGFRHALRPQNFSKALAHSIVVLAIVFPLAYAAYKKPVLYDGLRHFLFVVPPLATLAALSMDATIGHMARRMGKVGAALGVALVGLHTADMMIAYFTYHPHQYVYFNRIIGGLQGADGKYSTDYYGEAYKEAAEQLLRKVWLEDPEGYLTKTYAVAGCIGEGNVTYYLPRNFTYRRNEKVPVDFWVGYTRQRCHLQHSEHPVYLEVRRDGGLLTVVRDMRQHADKKTEAGQGVKSTGKRRTGRKTKKGVHK